MLSRNGGLTALACCSIIWVATGLAGAYFRYSTEWREGKSPGELPFWIEVKSCHNTSATGSFQTYPMQPPLSSALDCPEPSGASDDKFIIALNPKQGVRPGSPYSLVFLLAQDVFGLAAFSVSTARGEVLAPPAVMELGSGEPSLFPWRAAQAAGRALRGFGGGGFRGGSFGRSSHSYGHSSSSSYGRTTGGYSRPPVVGTPVRGTPGAGGAPVVRGVPVAHGTPVASGASGGSRWGGATTTHYNQPHASTGYGGGYGGSRVAYGGMSYGVGGGFGYHYAMNYLLIGATISMMTPHYGYGYGYGYHGGYGQPGYGGGPRGGAAEEAREEDQPKAETYSLDSAQNRYETEVVFTTPAAESTQWPVLIHIHNTTLFAESYLNGNPGLFINIYTNDGAQERDWSTWMMGIGVVGFIFTVSAACCARMLDSGADSPRGGYSQQYSQQAGSSQGYSQQDQGGYSQPPKGYPQQASTSKGGYYSQQDSNVVVGRPVTDQRY